MDKLRTVQVFEGDEDLVNDVTFMDLLEQALADHVVHVSLHVLEQEVDVAVVLGFVDFVEGDDVRMLQLFQDADLAVGSLGVGRVLECVEDFFQGEDF
jgi:hypothetical protein